MVFPIELGVRVIAEQVVRAEIGDHAFHATGEVVAIDDREAVGVFGERVQRVEPGVQAGCVDGERDFLLDRLFEDHQPSRIDRVEPRHRRDLPPGRVAKCCTSSGIAKPFDRSRFRIYVVVGQAAPGLLGVGLPSVDRFVGQS